MDASLKKSKNKFSENGEVEEYQTNMEEKSSADLLPRNEYGGVLITEKQIKAAFEFFDVQRKGKITVENLKSRLGIFNKNLTSRDYKFLMNNASEITVEDLKKLLMDNEVIDFDPVAEAFKTYDPEGTGYVDMDVLRSIFENLGFGQMTEEDMHILMGTGDIDKDGKISLEDFRNLLYI